VAPDPLTFPALLRRNRDVHGDKPALVTHQGSITHAALEDRSAGMASRFVASGVSRSSRVGLMMENGIEWAVIGAAVMRIGAVLVPLSTLLKPPELHGQLQTASVTELIVTTEFRGRSYLFDLEVVAPGITTLGPAERHTALPNLRHIWTTGSLPSPQVEGTIVAALEETVRPADDLVILFTSGSRGVPKGVIHTHGGAIRATSAGLDCRCVGAHERLYIPMPFFWTGGFSGGLMTALVAGATLLTEAVPDADSTLDLLEREKVTLFRGWPDQAARLASHPRFASADLTNLGPGSLPAVLPPEKRPESGARANLFGMTETFGPYCGDRLDTDLPEGKHGSCGRPFDGMDVQIFDLETGDPCSPGVDGEIGVRGPNVMRGICRQARSETFDASGYYRTGDLGHLDLDGYLWYRGRSDDMFKVSGATVYPAEVESALQRVHGVRQAFVTNVPSETGEQVGALVVTDLTVDALDVAVRARLSSFKVPVLWYVTDRATDVPRTATDKVAKPALQALLTERGARASFGLGLRSFLS
jgi:acyl-CoA synthetase (AMP-forming)/AMP-acid ligase II